MAGGAVGISEFGYVTSGGESGSPGGLTAQRRLALALAGLFALMVLLQLFSGYSTAVTDLRRSGSVEPAWHVAVWQGSSTLIWLTLAPAIWHAVARIEPAKTGWPGAIVQHVVLTVPVSLAHVLGMVAVRHVAYALGGETYRFADDWAASLFYEYKKDIVTYGILALFAAAAQRALQRGGETRLPSAPVVEMLEVPDGKVVLHIPLAEIGWAAAAGNYVEIGWRERTVLQRSTLGTLAKRLGTGFIQIHRGRIVRRDAIRSIETERSGDFVILLRDGTRIRGSRRYRGAL